MIELFNNWATQFSHLLSEWVKRCFLLWGFVVVVAVVFRSFSDLKGLQFTSEHTTPTEFPEKHLSNWPQRKGCSATKPFTP